MKKYIIILAVLPFILFSQVNNELGRSQKRNINQSIIDCLSDYESESKVTKRNEDEFYELFSDDESIIDDIIPSNSFGRNINSTNWIDLMKYIQIYNVKTEIIEFERYNPISSDTGTVFVIVNKEVITAMWSDNKKGFNIERNENKKQITQKVRYSSKDKYIFEFSYKLLKNKNKNKYNSVIISIKPFDKLSKRNIYIPYKTSLISLKKQPTRIIDFDLFKDISDLEFQGDKIRYFLDVGEENINLDKYTIKEYKKPKISDDEGVIKELTYRIKFPLSLTYSPLVFNSIDLGSGLQPSIAIDHRELFNISANLPIFSFGIKKLFSKKSSKKSYKLTIGLKGSLLKSTSSIELYEYQSTTELLDPNPGNSSGNTYIRKNSITDFKEVLNIDQKLAFLTFKLNITPKFRLSVNRSIYSINTIQSVRSTNAKYSAIFPQYNNIEIDETIYFNNGESLELGYKSWVNFEEEMNFSEKQNLWQFGLEYTLISINYGTEIIFAGSYNTNSSNWFNKQESEISQNPNEFNSFVDVAEKIQFKSRIRIGFMFRFKL